MKLRAILLLSGASLLLAVSIPSGLALAEEGATQQEKGQTSKGETSKGEEGAAQRETTSEQTDKGEKSKGEDAAAQRETGKQGAAERKGDDGVKIPMAPVAEMRAERMPEGMSKPDKSVPCPHPYSQTQNATNPAYRDATDFSGWNYSWATVGDSHPNRVFGYTFKLNIPSDRLCCEITKAVLTLNLKCLDDIPGNDTWAIVHNGHGVTGSGGPIGWPQICNGQTKTVSYAATPAVLNMMNQDHRLSFLVQDDTTVERATLTVTGCCVRNH